MSNPYTRRNIIILLAAIILVAAATTIYLLFESKSADKTKSDILSAPAYATNRGAIEELAKSQGIDINSGYYDYTNSGYLVYTASDGEAMISPGFIGYLIEYKLLQFQFEHFTAWGQSCYVRSSEDFFISDGVLMIPVESTSTDPSFIKKCQAMISPAITGYKVIATQGDGDFKVTYQKVTIPFSVVVQK